MESKDIESGWGIMIIHNDRVIIIIECHDKYEKKEF